MSTDTINTVFTALECLLIGVVTVIGCALMACLVLRCWVRKTNEITTPANRRGL